MKIKRIIAVFTALSMLLLCACGVVDTGIIKNKAEELVAGVDGVSNTGNFRFNKSTFPKIGAMTAAVPLGEAVAASALGILREDAAELVSLKGSLADNYKAVCDGELDLIFAFEPDEEAKEYMKEKGVELEMTPVCLDALVILTSAENEILNLSVSQINRIYCGEITSWKEVGGAKKTIKAYQRRKGSGSQVLFDRLINPGDKLIEATKSLIRDSLKGTIEAVAEYDNSENAIGYTSYYYLTNMEKVRPYNYKILSVGGVSPSDETVSDGTYPLTLEVYAVIRKSAAKESPERILYNWICSPQGAQLIKNENYPVKLVS